MHVDVIDTVNSKTRDEFQDEYFPPSDWQSWTHPKTKIIYQISLQTSATLSPQDFESCFHLIDYTSSSHYRRSVVGWKPQQKQDEMKLPDMKYILVMHQGRLGGFTSFMPSYEDGFPVLYCYEIHITDTLKGYVFIFIVVIFIFFGCYRPAQLVLLKLII